MKAYGACAYIVSENESSLVIARNRVASLRQMTIPKLELMGAVIGVRLCDHVMSNMRYARAYIWSDSQIVLSWLSSEKMNSIYINNRVKEIKKLTDSHQWRYCPTERNPADILSRGLSYDKLRDNSLWMHGPAWLTNDKNGRFWTTADRISTPTYETAERDFKYNDS